MKSYVNILATEAEIKSYRGRNFRIINEELQWDHWYKKGYGMYACVVEHVETGKPLRKIAEEFTLVAMDALIELEAAKWAKAKEIAEEIIRKYKEEDKSFGLPLFDGIVLEVLEDCTGMKKDTHGRLSGESMFNPTDAQETAYDILLVETAYDMLLVGGKIRKGISHLLLETKDTANAVLSLLEKAGYNPFKNHFEVRKEK